MRLKTLISNHHIAIDSTAQSKTAVFQKISQLLSQNNPKLCQEELFDAYWQRERLGSTAIGHGVVIPHIRVKGDHSPQACLIRLLHPIDFGAEDRQPADLIMALVVPKEETELHLQLLRDIVKLVSQHEFRQQCRAINCEKQLYDWLITQLA